MGACATTQEATAPQVVTDEDTNDPRKLLEKGTANIKNNLIAQYKNKTMVQEIIKMLFTFVHSTLTTNPAQVNQFIGLTFMGWRMNHARCNVKLGGKIALALKELTEPEDMSRCRSLEDNFLSCAHKFEEVEAQFKRSRAQRDGGSAVDQREHRAASREDDDELDPSPSIDSPILSYKELQKTMLSVLGPLCDMVDGLLNPAVEKKFREKTGKGSEYLQKLKNTLGIATTIVTVFDPSDKPLHEAGHGIQLLAVMGPESYGKSTLINHILSNGQNKEFMPATAGMGTQVICKIAAGPLETLQTTEDEFPVTGEVKGMVEKINSKMSQLRSDRALKNESLSIKEMEMLRATVKFDPPYPVEFLDVPGTKEETLFHTRVALGLATTLVLVCGRADDLRSQLERGGDLVLVKDAVEGLNQPIPIQCLAVRIPEDEFNTSKRHIKQALEEHFPTCRHLIKEPLFMNFIEARDNAHKREDMVEKFYDAMATSEKQVLDPIARFLLLENEVEIFTETLAQFFRGEMQDYLTSEISSPEGAAYKVKEGISNYLTEMQEDPSELKAAFSPEKIKRRLGEVRIARLGVHRHYGAGSHQKEVKNVAYHVQSILNDCRIRHMEWLKDSAQDFHKSTFGKVFTPLKNLVDVTEQRFNRRLCDAFKYCSRQPGRGDKEQKAWWTQEYTSQIAAYLDPTALGFLLTGFYLVSTDTKNTTDFLGMLESKGVTANVDVWNSPENSVKEQMIGELNQLNYAEWIKKCNDRNDRKGLFEELYKAIEDACEKFKAIALGTGFLDSVKENLAMGALVEITFVLTERIFVEITDENEGDYTYTKFSEHLRKATGNDQLRKQRVIIEGEDPEKACSACGDALQLMQKNPNVSSTWKTKFEDKSLEQEIAKIQMLRKMLSQGFVSGGEDRAILLIPQETRNMVTKRSVTTSGQAYPIPSAALAILDQRMKWKAGAKAGKDFATFALREIQRVGARVAVFMRRADAASYDPLNDEIMLLEKLRVEPNLVTLFVLWTPSNGGLEWSTPVYIQKWKNSNSSDSYLDVRLIPMTESFDGHSFINDEVNPAVKAARAQATTNLGKIRESENKLLVSFAGEVSRYEDEYRLARGGNPKRIHKTMGEDIRTKVTNLMQRLTCATESLEIPPWEFNRENFKVETLDRAAFKRQQQGAPGEDAEESGPGDAVEHIEGTSVNELQCRSFHVHVLLGQCVQKCSKLAGKVHDSVVTTIWNEIGEKEFFMTGSKIIEEIDNFRKLYNGNDEYREEIRRLQLLKLMITKQSFQHMYVGCVSYMLMPALYATVLPTLFKGMPGKETPTDEVYKKHLQFAKTMLEDNTARPRGGR